MTNALKMERSAKMQAIILPGNVFCGIPKSIYISYSFFLCMCRSSHEFSAVSHCGNSFIVRRRLLFYHEERLHGKYRKLMRNKSEKFAKVAAALKKYFLKPCCFYDKQIC